MQTRRHEISSKEFREVLTANPARKFLDISISTGTGLLPTNPGVVQMCFDAASEQYKLVWVLRPFQPHIAPGNSVFLRAVKDDPSDPDDVTVVVEVTEGIEVEA